LCSLLSALCATGLGAGAVFVATTKQDCIGSSHLSERVQIAVELLPRYAYSDHAAAVAASAEERQSG
jgi:hypothetical protein